MKLDACRTPSSPPPSVPARRWWLSLAALWVCFLLLLVWCWHAAVWPCDTAAAAADRWSGRPAAAGPVGGGEDYWTERRRLLTADQLLEVGGSLVLHGKERRVNDLLTALKRAEFLADPFTAGRHFLNAREDIQRSAVFDIIRMMPKGAMLHIHDISMLSAEVLVANITYMDHLYLCNSTQQSGAADVRLKFLASPDDSCDWRLLSDVRAERGAAAVDSWLLTQLSMITQRPEDVYPDLRSSWDAFDAVISAVRGVIYYEPAWRRYVQLALQQMAQDNIQYAELRTAVPQLNDLSGQLYPASHTLEIYQQALLAERLRAGGLKGGRLILAMSRHVSPQQVAQDVDEVLRLRAAYPDLMAGFDLVAEEDLGQPLKQFVPELLRLPRNGVPTFYHAGETYWLGTDVDENLYDAVLLNASRIGHGYGIVKHPLLLEEVMRRGVAIEVCPISNQVLGLVSDLRNHPAAVLLAVGAPVVVSADDPGSWGAAGLSYDLYMTLMAVAGRRADLSLLKQLAVNSIRYSSLPAAERVQLEMEWEALWDNFIDAVIAKYQL